MFKKSAKAILVTGGCGFIGNNLVRYILNNYDFTIINLDKLTYAGNVDSLCDISSKERYKFVQGDIGDRNLVRKVLAKEKPWAILNLAAESHVDRSIDGPDDFVQTNIVGTFNLLEEVRYYWNFLEAKKREKFRFLHVSTDEVFGSLRLDDAAFTENHQYSPNSPYSASKAASDHLVRSYFRTYGLPTLTTHCSNNYGPYQFPEKLIPLMVLNCLSERALPVYGDGQNIRDWLYVGDHCCALMTVLLNGKAGQTYNIGGNCEKKNIEIVCLVCSILDEKKPRLQGKKYNELITFVKDRPGHDLRYAMNTEKIRSELGWRAVESFETGLEKTIVWYLNNNIWTERILSGKYQLERLGVATTQRME